MPMTKAQRRNADFRVIAERIANKLFVNGAGEKADRAMLVQEPNGLGVQEGRRDLGGYCRSHLRDCVEDILKAEFAGKSKKRKG